MRFALESACVMGIAVECVSNQKIVFVATRSAASLAKTQRAFVGLSISEIKGKGH